VSLAIGAEKILQAHVWQREADEHYVEPFWCSERLFEEEKFDGPIWDPCCGFGRIPESAARAGHLVVATDIKNRGYRALTCTRDFLTMTESEAPNVICNPPFNITAAFARHALSLPGVDKVAMIFPTARLNAAHWLRETPLLRVWLMTPRPSMPPGHTIAAGEKPGGGKMDFCWLVWAKGHQGLPELRWLRRDGNQPAQEI
jgi:hypothetical protein